MEIPVNPVCRVCGEATHSFGEALLLAKHRVHYFECDVCGYVQTEDPYWLEEAYQNPVNLTDTGLLGRNVMLSRMTLLLLRRYFKKGDFVLDYSGGYGVLTRLLRDAGAECYWHDPYTPNVFARGFEMHRAARSFSLVTSFESFEHFVYPLEEIRKISQISSEIFFSTRLLPPHRPQPGQWWYYGLEHGQHIGFFTPASLAHIAKELGLHVVSAFGAYHFLSRRKIHPLSFAVTLAFSRTPFVSLFHPGPSLTVRDSEFLSRI